MAAYDRYARGGLQPVTQKGWDVWWDWCLMHPPPMGRKVEGVKIHREEGVVKISGDDVGAVRRVVRGQRAVGEKWVRVRGEERRCVRQKQAGPMAGQTGKQRTQGAGRRQGPMARVVRVTRARRGVRARMDAGAVERMRRQLVTRDVERARAGVVEERFGDG